MKALVDEFWQVGDIVSRDGTDEHVILAFNDARDLVTVKCVKEPKPWAENEKPWIALGETEINTPWRYMLVRRVGGITGIGRSYKKCG